MRRRTAIYLASLALLSACNGGRGGTHYDTGACSMRTVSVGLQGELTAFPSIQTSIIGADLGLHSVNFIVVPAMGDYLGFVRVFAEVENVGTTRLCSATFSVLLGGFDGDGLLAAPRYAIPLTGTSPLEVSCLEPGARGVIVARIFDVTEDDLLATAVLRIDLSNSIGTDAANAMPEDVVTLSDQHLAAVDGGYELVQTATASASVRNYYQDVYGVDSRGLLIADLDVPSYGPTAGGASLEAGVPQELDSNVVDCELTDFFVAGTHYIDQ